MVSFTLRPLYPHGKISFIHCTGGWVNPISSTTYFISLQKHIIIIIIIIIIIAEVKTSIYGCIS